MGASVSSMVTRVQRGVDVVFEAPRWSERWVLEDDVTMPESSEHEAAINLLKDTLRAWVGRTRRDAVVYANLAVRWDEEHPTVGVDPDVCVVEPAPPEPKLQSLLTWEPGHHAPRLAIEVVSRKTARKDYNEGPAKYAACGAEEVWIFDPERRGRGLMGGPWTIQVWQRTKAGAFRQVYAGAAPAYSDALDAWLVVTDHGTRLRIADDEAGERLWPTDAETECARADTERARADTERARADTERARADALAARLAALEGR
jgi:Uma2 family endonuclease